MEQVERAAEIIKKGGVVIFPTDTAFGIGCRMDDEAAVKRLFSLRKRPPTKATPVLAADLHMIEPYLQQVPQDVVEKLIEPFWPGGLTIVMRCHVDNVPEMVRNNDTLGVRVPNHLTTLALINAVGVPIIGSSANFAGAPTPYHIDDLDPALVNLVDFVIPGETITKEASTVVDVTQTPWKILRDGAVKLAL